MKVGCFILLTTIWVKASAHVWKGDVWISQKVKKLKQIIRYYIQKTRILMKIYTRIRIIYIHICLSYKNNLYEVIWAENSNGL